MYGVIRKFFRNCLQGWKNAVLQQLAPPNMVSHSQESVFYHVETLYNTFVRFDGVHGIDNNIINR